MIAVPDHTSSTRSVSYGAHARKRAPVCPSLTLGVLIFATAATLASDELKPLKADSDAPYVHRISLYDHDGEIIDPTDDFAGPYSPKQTCGKCHAYAEIHGGWHFNAGDLGVPPGRNGEPWWLIDEETGTQIPISQRDWPGVFSPKEAGLTHWQMVKRFGHHIPGGGFGEPSDEIIESEPESLRWNISGKLEIDCMFCHSADSQHDPAEAARQIERENFKWSPTAAYGLASIRGDAAKAPDDWDPMLGPDPDNPEASGPSLEWNLSRFDADYRVFFNIAERPPNERCLFCHTSHEVGPGAPPEIMQPRDVHLAAGLMCVDCHTNGEDHNIVRGYEAEATDTGEPARAAYSCRGCHLGVEGAADPELALGGHFGAPHSQHKGLPPIHFEKLACTACHSGPWPETDAKQFQTALAHGLGLASRERDAATPPEIVGPIFVPQSDLKIAPRLNEVNQQAASTRPWWSIAHDVRPAAQSLGASGCQDCHADDAAMFFGQVGATLTTAGDDAPTPLHMWQVRLESEALAHAWAFGFKFRPIFKWLTVACVILLVFLIRRAMMTAANGPSVAHERVGFTPYDHLIHVVAIIGVVIQTLTGPIAEWFAGGVHGWTLFVHMLGAPMFVVGTTLVAWRWAYRLPLGGNTGGQAASGTRVASGATFSRSQRLLFWICVLLAFWVTAPMLAAMFPIAGYAGQELLIEVHEIAAILFVIAMIVHTIVSLAAKRSRSDPRA